MLDLKLKIAALLVTVAVCEHPTARGGLLTADDVTIVAGDQGTLNVVWSTTQPLNFLSTQFVLRAVGGTRGGAVFATDHPGDPPMPPIGDPRYVFFNNSSAIGNPAAVTQSDVNGWMNDSYTMADGTILGEDYPQDGLRLWTTLTIRGLISGTYRLGLVSSQYDIAASTGGFELTDADLNGGLVTITGVAAIPEPSGVWLAAIGIGLAARHAKRTWRGQGTGRVSKKNLES